MVEFAARLARHSRKNIPKVLNNRAYGKANTSQNEPQNSKLSVLACPVQRPGSSDE